MKIAEFSIKRPVALLMFYLAVIILGFVSLRELSVDLLPNISYPRLSVITQCPGVAPEEIETLVTAPLEAEVSRIPGIRRVESISKEGVSFMTLEFNWGINMDFTMLHTREKLDNARHNLPEDAENPTIIPLDPQSKPIMVMTISGERGLLELKEFAEELVKPRLEQIEGIGSAEVTGGVEREIHIEINPQLLALFGLTIDQVASQINSFNQSLQGGTIRKGRFKYALRIVGEFEVVNEIGEISLLTTAERGIVRLKDVARIQDSIKEREGMSRLDGKESIGILVRKEAGSNTVKVTKKAKSVIEQIIKENPQINIMTVSEQSKYIEKAIATTLDEIIEGAILAFLTLLIFLQEWKTPLIIDTVIPISIIGTFNLLYFNNITLNIMSLGGLALGVGMLDDCAVVVSENIFRHRSQGKSLSEAAYIGTKEVGMAVTATALTTIVVFLPVIYVHGVAGPLFKDTALTVTFSLLSSLLVSLTLLPMLESRKFELQPVRKEFIEKEKAGKGKTSEQKKKLGYLFYPFKGLKWLFSMIFKGILFVINFILSYIIQLFALVLHYLSLPFKPLLNMIFKGFNLVYKRFVARYEQWLKWSLDNKGKVIAGFIVFFGVTFFLGTQIRRELMPKLEISSFELLLKTPVDYSLEQTAEITTAVEQFLGENESVKLTFSQIGIVSGMESLNPDVSLNSAKIYIEVKKPSQIEGTLESLRRRLANYPDLSYSIIREQSTLAQFLAFSTAEIGLKIKGDDLLRLREISEELVGKLRSVSGIADLNTNIGEGKPEFLLKIKPEALEKYANISPWAVANFLVSAVRGKRATQFRELEKRYDVLVRFEENSRENIESILNGEFPHSGRLIPLRELVNCEIARGPKEIRRENQQREVLVTANLRGTKISQVVPKINEKIKEISLPPNYQIIFSGELEEMKKSFKSLIFALILAILLNYMIMAAQFESLLHPFLVMLTLPMGAAGSFFILFVTGQTLNVISIIGMVVLVGLVVDDAIVEIDYTNQLRRSGKSLRESVFDACRVRLRPILMASLSTIFGLIPLSLGLERGAELLKPLGIVVIGGLTFATFLTLILIPVTYEWIEARRAKNKQ
jgi:HAE1 family hydrophobic/amphiphilic exporter-1